MTRNPRHRACQAAEAEAGNAKFGRNENVSDQLSFAELRAANMQRVPFFGHSLNDWSESQWSNAMAGEAGEVCNVTKKRSRAPGMNEKIGKKTPTVQDLAEEIADIIIYADLLAASAGIDLAAAVRQKFNAVSDKLGPAAPRILQRFDFLGEALNSDDGSYRP